MVVIVVILVPHSYTCTPCLHSLLTKGKIIKLLSAAVVASVTTATATCNGQTW